MIYGNITNCSVVGHGVRPEWECRLGYQVISEDTATNTRKVLLQLEARSINREYYATGYLLTPTIDGQPLNPIGMNFSQANTNIWQVLGNRIITIVGAFNGEKYGSFVTNLTSNWGLKSGSASVYIVLDNLHTPPQITSIDSEEINSSLNQYDGIAQFLSVKNYTFHTETFDDATISSYQIHHNGVLIGSSEENGMTINFDTFGTLATFEMNGTTYCTLKFVVIDSFGVSGSKEVQVEVIKYVKPNLVQTSSSIKRNGQLSGKVKMTLVGSFFNQSINEIPNVINLQFKYWKKGAEEPSEYYDIPYEAIDNNINLFNWAMAIDGEEIEDVDSNFAYNFKIKATDYFNKTSEIELLCPVGEYLWAEFKDRVDFKKITVQGNNPFLYSTQEIKIGKTEDGHDVYRKEYIGTIISESTEILESNVNNIILINGYGNANNQIGTQVIIGQINQGYGAVIYIYNGNLTLSHTSDIVGNYRAIVEYIKIS